MKLMQTVFVFSAWQLHLLLKSPAQVSLSELGPARLLSAIRAIRMKSHCRQADVQGRLYDGPGDHAV